MGESTNEGLGKFATEKGRRAVESGGMGMGIPRFGSGPCRSGAPKKKSGGELALCCTFDTRGVSVGEKGRSSMQTNIGILPCKQ